MNVSMILADAAAVAEGKLFVLGGGWNVATLGAPSALALLIEVDWDETNRRHSVELSLVDGDGHPVSINAGAGQKPLSITAQFEVGRPPGIPVGSSLNQPLAISLGALPLTPGRMYEWRCSIDGKPLSRRSFLVRNAQ